MQKKGSQYQDLDKFGRPLPPKRGDYYVPSITTDAIVFRPFDSPNPLEVLLITRGREPYKGKLAFPGGFLEYNEIPEAGCLRELEEETGLHGLTTDLLTVSGEPLRDPRGHTVSCIYIVTVKEGEVPLGGDDAADAKYYKLDEVLPHKELFSFDHHELLVKAVEKQSKTYKK